MYDLIAKRFISVFYPDCKFSTTTVIGEVVNEDGDKPDKIEFKVSGKEILEPGWREVYAKDVKANDEEDSQDGNSGGDAGNGANKKENVEERTLPSFVKGESGDHTPTLTEKWTTPPKYYTEATLLRAMETAGKFVEDEELRAALKENGIGRPSSRAGIIETLFKRHYIRRQRKNLMATPTGIELIDTIHEELLKSCELTGIWEKKLREVDAHGHRIIIARGETLWNSLAQLADAYHQLRLILDSSEMIGNEERLAIVEQGRISLGKDDRTLRFR